MAVAPASVASADPPPGYYNSVDTTDPTTLRASLHAVIDDHTRYPYSSGSTDTWDILETAQQDPADSGKIIDIYRNRSYTKIGGGMGPYNREHTWPKSYGFPDDHSGNYPYTDCHQLYLCDTGYNSDRGNKPFRTCTAGCSEHATDANDGHGGGSGSYPGNSNWASGSSAAGTWEVWIGRRGDVARAQFYLDVRYEGGNHGGTGAWEPDLILTDNQTLIANSSTGNNETVAYMGMLAALLQWHLEDPVDDRERARNDVIFGFQGNRNPFVDHPEWVECLFNGNCVCQVDADCADSLFCNGAETCDTVLGCQPGPPACPAGTWCDEAGDACPGLGDFDIDGDVDLSDFRWFQLCYDQPAGGGCEAGDFTGDQFVDQADYPGFEAQLSGPI